MPVMRAWDGTQWVTLPAAPADPGTANIAANVSVVPAGNISSTNVQAALQELDTEKSKLNGDAAQSFVASNLQNFVTTIAALKTVDKTKTSQAVVLGYSAVGDGGGGDYRYDSTDTTSADNGGTIIVANDGGRWKLINTRGVTIKHFGAKGDGSTDDSTAFNNAATFCAANFIELLFPPGVYRVPNATTRSGRCLWRGIGQVRLVGNIVYQDLTFGPSADINSGYSSTAPFFSSKFINYESIAATYALRITCNDSGSFQDTGEVFNASFYGAYGIQAQNCISLNLRDCWFYNTSVGVLAQAGINWTIENCRFRNCAEVGFSVADFGTSRRGGENMRFIGCEWATCSVAVKLFRCLWASFENCLMDYCGLPLWLVGSQYVKLTKTYLGADLRASTQSTLGYIAPPSTGTAVFAEGYIAGAIREASGITAIECEFVNYMNGSPQPIVYLTGFDAGTPSNRLVDSASIISCKFIHGGTSHAAQYLLYIDHAQQVQIIAPQFISYNLSSTLVGPFFLDTVDFYNSFSVDTYLLREGGIEKPSQYPEKTYIPGVGQRSIGVGPPNSAGAGYRQLLVPN